MFFKYNKNSATKRNVRNFVVFAVVMLFTTVFLSLFPEQVYAARKTKTLVITDLYPGASITPHYVNDYTKDDIAATTINYGNSGTLTLPSGWGSIKVTFSGNTATVTLTNVDVYKKTPYLEIYAGTRPGYIANGWKTVTDEGNNGMDDGTNANPPKENEWHSNTCDFYMGVAFTKDEIKVKWAECKYYVRYNGNGGKIASATTHFGHSLAAGATQYYHGNSSKGYQIQWIYDSENGNKLNNNLFTKSGYTFIGWALKDEDGNIGDVEFTANQAGVKNLTEKNGDTVDLYAVWEKNNTVKYHVKYNGNKGTIAKDINRYGTTVTAGSTSYYHANKTGYDALWTVDSENGNTLNKNYFNNCYERTVDFSE